MDGVSTWLSGDCGDHPNNTIAKLMLQAVWQEACQYKPVLQLCQPIHTPAKSMR